MHGAAELRAVRAVADERQRRARALHADRRPAAQRAPHAARVALGHLLVRLGHRLSGVSPGPA